MSYWPQIGFQFKLNSINWPHTERASGRFYQNADISLRVPSVLHFFSPDEGYGQSDDVAGVALFHIGGKINDKKVVEIVTRMRGRFRLIFNKE